MSGEALLSTWLRPARRARIAQAGFAGAPIVALGAAMAWRGLGGPAALGIILLGAALVAAVAWAQVRRYDHRWLARQLDASRADIENSADLLLAEPTGLNPLQQLQRARLERRLADETGAQFRPAWPTRRLAAVWAIAAVGVAALLLPPRGVEDAPLAPAREDVVVPPGVPRLVAQQLRVVPPAYTGLPARTETRLDIRAPEGSRLVWRLRFDPQPTAAALVSHRGERLALRRAGNEWVAERRLDRAMLYRVTPAGAPAKPLPPLHRLDATPDLPPRLTALVPRQSLTYLAPGQRRWPLTFEATDDYGLAATAQLLVTITEGEGENITFKERTLTLSGSGPARRRRFTAALDPMALGLTRGNDVVAQLTVRDRRSPSPHVVRGSSVILRWSPEPPTQGSGVEGLLKKVMPAYFRSQRQIIIDAEKLLRDRPRISAETFFERSNVLAADQKLLRLRYGKFMGEVSSNEAPPPTNDGTATSEPAPSGDEHGAGHDVPAAGATSFGNAADVTGAYGHTHDESEAATLLDPETRATLRQALDQMWQSELHLRQSDPRGALPYAYKALAFIKAVQQASRVYLARVGPQLPPIDEARRMTGKRDGLERRALPPLTAAQVATAPTAAWAALEDVAAPVPLDALEAWLVANEARVPDPLGLVTAIDALRQDPRCAACRDRLRGRLWAALPRVPARVPRRDAGDAAGRRYLDALGRQ